MKKLKVFIIILLALIMASVTVCFIPIRVSRFIPLIEKQVSKELGLDVHLNRLILRLGPSLKLKSPIMHVMYKDGQKIAQFENIKIYIPWTEFLKNDIKVKKIFANKLILNINSNDKCLNDLVSKLNKKDSAQIPNITLKKYSFSYKDNESGRKYRLIGEDLNTSKIRGVKNWKTHVIGNFFINDKKYLSYDISVLPLIDSQKIAQNIDVKSFLDKIEDFDFHTDIIADLKIYKGLSNDIQMSGLVNFDNISVLDPAKKLPKSFIYLTLLGNKIGILSNIYSSAEDKVYVEGVVNNSQKKSLDLKVKTDEVQLKDIYMKIKLLTDFSKYNVIDSIEGTLKADFNIKGDLNKLKSFGYLKVDNASVKYNGINISNITSNIDFSNNQINITDAIGYVNNSPIMLKGKIDKNIDLEMIMSKISLRNLFPESFGIERGIASLSTKITGTINNIIHKENLSIENFKYAKDSNVLTFDSFKIDTNKDNIAYIHNIILKNKQIEPIKLSSLKVYVNKESIKIPDTVLSMPNSKLKIKGEILDYATNNLTFSIILNGFINAKDFKIVSNNAEMYPVKFLGYGNKKIQNISSQIYMEKPFIFDEPALLNLNSRIENNSIKIEDLSVYSFTGKLSDDFKQNIKGNKKINISGCVENLKNPQFKNLRIFIPQQLNLNFYDTIAQIKGDLFLNGNLKTPDIVGQLAIHNFINQFLDVTANNSTIDFNKDVATISIPQLKVADSVMGIHSIISTDLSKGLNIKNLNIKSKYINTDTFLMYKDTPAFSVLPIISINEGKLYSEKASATIYKSNLNLAALSTNFKFFDSTLSLKNLSALLYNGKIAGDINFNLVDESYETMLQARGVSAAPIFDLISTKKDSVSGCMDFDTNIKGNLSSKKSLNGKIKFLVNNGRMGTLGKLEHLLYAQNVVADSMLRTSLSVVTRAITLKDTGLFKFLRGEVLLEDGIANIKYIQSQGPLMALYIKGMYNPEIDYGKLIVLGRLSDEIISGLGAFGDFSLKKLMVMATGDEDVSSQFYDDIDMLPQLPMKNTKEFRSVINGFIEKPSSVLRFNWISYSTKTYKQKEIPLEEHAIPKFVDSLPY